VQAKSGGAAFLLQKVRESARPFQVFIPFLLREREASRGDIAGPIIIPAKRSRLSNSLSASDLIFI